MEFVARLGAPARIARAAPLAVILAAPTRGDRSRDGVARTCGATPARRAVSVIAPSIPMGVASAAFLCFVSSREEIAVTSIIASADAITPPVPTRTWPRRRVERDVAAAPGLPILPILATVAGLGAATPPRRPLEETS